MFNRVRAFLRDVLVYLQENPGAATMVGGWVVVFVARFGLHVTVGQLAAIVAVLLPLISAHHALARRARAGRRTAQGTPEA